jgi:signal transduction histidine kinase
VVDPDKGLDGIRMFKVFAFVVYASREQPRDDIFSRSVTVFCEKAVRQTKKLIDEERAAALRTRWFAQRLRLYNQVRVNFTEFESEDGRMQELFSPLVVMSRLFGDPEAERNIFSYGREIEMRVRALETTSEEAEVVEAVVKAIEERARDAPEYLLNSEIINHLNGEWEPRKLGKLMTRLGFRKVKLTGGVRGYLIDYRLLARLVRRYEVKSSVIPPIENPIASFPK